MYNRNTYNIYSNKRDLQQDQEYNTKKIVLNSVNDLMNIPIQQLRTAQLKNFCGTLFDQLYQEAMAIEHNQEVKTQNEPSPISSHNSLKFKKNIKNTEKTLKNSNIKPILRKLVKKDDNNKIKYTPIRSNNTKINGNKKKSVSVEKTKKIIKIIKKIKKPKKLNESDINLKTKNIILLKVIKLKK